MNNSFLSLLLAAGLGAPLASRAQASTEPAAPAATAVEPAPTPEFVPRTLLKLGTGITRGLTVGGFMGTAVPIVVGVERQVAPSWSAYGNASSGWRIGARTAAPDGGGRVAYLTELGVDLGVRRYYHQAKRLAENRQAGPFIGNYVAVQASTSFTPGYGPRLYHEVTALSGVWGVQRSLGGHGLLDAYAGGGLETRRLDILRQEGLPIRPHLEVGIKLSLVR